MAVNSQPVESAAHTMGIAIDTYIYCLFDLAHRIGHSFEQTIAYRFLNARYKNHSTAAQI